jgi:hypothetical protein
MEAAAQPEQVNAEGMTAFNGRAGDGTPVTMLSLLRFKPQGGRERYAEYGAAVAPLHTEVLSTGELHLMDAGAPA